MIFPKSLVLLIDPNHATNVSKTGEVLSYLSDDMPVVKFLSQELGFSYRIYSAAYRYDGDLLLGNFILSEKYFNKSTYPFALADYTFATVKPGYSSNSLAPIRPFAMSVWMMLLLSIVLMTFTTFLIFWRRVPLPSVLFYVSVALLGTHRDWKPKSKAQKLVVLTWSVCMTLLTLAYGAVILSFFTVPVREKGISNLEKLYDAIIKGKATASKFQYAFPEIGFIESGSEKLKFIGEHIQKQDVVSRNYHGGNAFAEIKPNVAVIALRVLLEIQYGGDGYFIAQDSAFFGLRVMYEWTENGFCCMDKINAVIHRIWGAGLYNKYWDGLVFRNKLTLRKLFPNTYSRVENTVQPLSLSDMSGAFYVLLTGHILAVICLLCEIVSDRYFCRNQIIPNFRRKRFRKRD